MDFHFYQSSKKGTGKTLNVSKTFLTFLPLFVLAALLPISVALVKTPVTDKFQSQAALNDLTVWFTPSSVTGAVGKAINLTVYAHFESNHLLPGITFPISVDGPASVENAQINSITPFNGQVNLGVVKIIPFRKGTVIVKVDPKFIKSPTYTGVFNASVSSTTIIVE